MSITRSSVPVLCGLLLLVCGFAQAEEQAAHRAGWLPINWGGLMSKSEKTDVASKIAQFKEDDDVVTLQFSPDGRQLAVGTGSTLHIDLWAWQGHSHIERTLTKPLPADLLQSNEGLRYSPDGKLLAVAHAIASDADGRSVVDIFDPQTGKLVHKISELRLGGTHSRIEFSPDGKFLVRTFDSDDRSKTGQFMVHRTDTWEVVWNLNTRPLYVQALALTRDGGLAAVSGFMAGPGVSDRAQVLVIDLQKRAIIRTIDNVFPPQTTVTTIAWHPDGAHLVVGSDGMGHGISEDLAEFPPEPIKFLDASSGEITLADRGGPTAITGLRYTSDGKYFIESGFPKMARIWDGQHRELLQDISVNKSFALSVSRDNRFLALGDGPHVSIWELK